MTWVMPLRTIEAASRPSMRSPFRVTEPLVILPSWMSRSPEIARNVVVFPAPLAPSNATI